MDGHGRYWNTANSQKFAGLFQDEFTSVPFVHNYGEDNDVEETGFPEQPKDIHISSINVTKNTHNQSPTHIYILSSYCIHIYYAHLCAHVCTHVSAQCQYTCHVHTAYPYSMQHMRDIIYIYIIISYIYIYYHIIQECTLERGVFKSHGHCYK